MRRGKCISQACHVELYGARVHSVTHSGRSTYLANRQTLQGVGAQKVVKSLLPV